jgi:hypothetical protein
MRAPPRHMQSPGNSQKIRMCGSDRRETGTGDERGDRPFEAGSELEHQMTVRSEQPVRIRRDGAVGGEAIGATVERKRRVMRPHLPSKPGNLAGGHLGWVRDDKVEGSGECLPEIARDEPCARRKA